MRASPAGRGRLPASTPVLFVIDGDPGAAHALRDDLSRRFGREFRIVCESAADAVLAALGDLAVRRVPTALLVGQDLGRMSGVAFLGRAREMHPQAVRVLLVERDYSAPSPIVQAMILGQERRSRLRPVQHRLPRRPRRARTAGTADPLQRSFPLRHSRQREGTTFARRSRVDDSRLPVLVRYDGQVTIRPDRAQLVAAVGGTVRDDIGDCDVAA